MSRAPASLGLVGISKSFGAAQVLRPLSLDVAAGEMLALLGPSGCGKTTTLRLIAGFEAPDGGHITIAGRDVTNLPPNRRALGMVFQNYSLFPHMTVGENVAFGLRMRGVARAQRSRAARTMLEMVRLGGFEDRQVHQLSGGQQQRIALARALATEPAVLLLDEPLGALDKSLRERMQFELRAIQGKLGITTILVTHDQEEALTMSDRIAVMAHGAVLQVGPPTEVYDRPRTRFVSEFLGTANVFTGTVALGAGDAAARLELQPGALGPLQHDGSLRDGERVTFAVRPERLRMGPPAADRLRARVEGIVFRGSYFAYELLAPGQDAPLFAYTPTRVEIGPDGVVGLSWQPENAVVLQADP